MELLGGVRFGSLFVRDHGQGAGRAAGARARNRWLGGVHRGSTPGEEYLLERKLFRRKSTGEVADPAWLLENTHPGKVHFALEDGDGRPSRWNTLRALRVLGWYEHGTRT